MISEAKLNKLSAKYDLTKEGQDAQPAPLKDATMAALYDKLNSQLKDIIYLQTMLINVTGAINEVQENNLSSDLDSSIELYSDAYRRLKAVLPKLDAVKPTIPAALKTLTDMTAHLQKLKTSGNVS
jgi:Rad3-related DNA helicase